MTVNSEALELLGALVLENGARFGEVAQPFQWEMANWLFDVDSEPSRWESRPRGGSKTTDEAGISMVAMLRTLPQGTRSYAVAVDRDQGRLIADAAAGFVARTPALASAITVDNYKITAGSGCVLEILAADAASTWGLKPALLIADEFCQWPSTVNGKGMWQALVSAMGKIRGAKLLCTSTSGDPSHWSHKVYETALKSKRWSVQEVPGPLPWVEEAFLDEQRGILPDSVFRRLHLNQWAAAEDRLTNLEDLRACVMFTGSLVPQSAHRYVMGIDLGIKHDRTVAAVCHKERVTDPDGFRHGYRLVLDHMEVWHGAPTRPVDLMAVEEWIGTTARRYKAHVIVDPYQAIAMAQRLRSVGVTIDEFAFSQQSVGRLAVTLHTAIRDRRLALPDDAELLNELANVRLRETSPNVYRLDHDPDRHDDRAIALALCAVNLLENPGSSAEGWIRQLSNSCPKCDFPTSIGSYDCANCGEVIGQVHSLYADNSAPVQSPDPDPEPEAPPLPEWPLNVIGQV
jgi:phage terminase large subunit-like protein